MKRTLVLIAALAAIVCYAGEIRLGTIVVTDGGTATNRTTGTTFVVPTNSKISIHTDEACFVGVGVSGCDAGMCIPLTANQLFPTSTNAAKTLTGCAYNVDAGCTAVTYTGGWVAVSPPSGGANCHGYVYARTGQE